MKINLGLYMNAKRGYTGSGALNGFAVRNIEQLLRLLGSSATTSNLNVDVVLARDSAEHRRPTQDRMSTTSETHWMGAHKLTLSGNSGAVVSATLGHQVTGDRAQLLRPKALEHFITDLRERDLNAPNVVVLWGHADGPRGFLFSQFPRVDGSRGRDILSPAEVDQALANSGQAPAPRKIVCADSCQAACLEFASVLVPHAEYFVASQTSVPGTGWNYESWPAILSAATGANWDGTVSAIVSDFAASNPMRTTISAMRLSAIDAVLNKLKSVTDKFLADPSARNLLLQARKEIKTHDQNLRGLVDFVMLFDGAARHLQPADLATECHDLARLMEAATIATHVSADLDAKYKMHGCSIFFPTAESAFGEPWDEITRKIYFEDDKQLARFKQTGWHKLLALIVPKNIARPMIL